MCVFGLMLYQDSRVHTYTLPSPQTQPMDWDDGSHGSSEEDDFEEEEETPIAPVRG